MITQALLLIFPALMAYAAASDLLTMRIPNALSLALLAAFGLLAIASGLVLQTVLLNLAACGIVLTVTFALFAFNWIGGGDAKLAAATALWLGFDQLPTYLIGASLLGGGLTLAILTLRSHPLPAFTMRWTWLARLHDPKAGVPYGIALAASALVVYPDSQIWSALLGR